MIDSKILIQRAYENPAQEIVRLHELLETMRWQFGMVSDSAGQWERFIVSRNVTEYEMSRLHDVMESLNKLLNPALKPITDEQMKTFEKELIAVLLGRKDLSASEITMAFADDNRWGEVNSAYLHWKVSLQ